MNIENIEDFMLTGKKLAYSIQFERKKNETTNEKTREKTREKTKEKTKEKTNEKTKEKTSDFIYPKQKDSLFWCFYIMKNGNDIYEMLENINIVVERKLKIEYVEALRKNKQVVKAKKIAPLTHIENYLVNEDRIDKKTFLALCLIENINVLYLHKRTYFLLNLNECDDLIIDNNIKYDKLHVVKQMDESLQFCIKENEDGNKIMEYMNTMHRIDNLGKPLKALSSYKVCELIEISKKLGIEITSGTSKKIKQKMNYMKRLFNIFNISKADFL